VAELKKMMLKDHFEAICDAFAKLWGEGSKECQVPGSNIDGYACLTEENFKRNISRVIGADEPMFGKMIYLWISKGFDRVKVTLN
jgi:hypothetical protein